MVGGGEGEGEGGTFMRTREKNINKRNDGPNNAQTCLFFDNKSLRSR